MAQPPLLPASLPYLVVRSTQAKDVTAPPKSPHVRRKSMMVLARDARCGGTILGPNIMHRLVTYPFDTPRMSVKKMGKKSLMNMFVVALSPMLQCTNSGTKIHRARLGIQMLSCVKMGANLVLVGGWDPSGRRK